MASSIVASATKGLGSLVVEKAKDLYEIRDKIERLQRDLQWMQCFLEDADNRQHREKVVAIWVADIRDFAYEAEEIIERYLHGVSQHRRNGMWNTMKWFSCVLCDARALHDVGSSIDDLRSRISELITRMNMFGIKTGNPLESSTHIFGRRTHSHIKVETVGLEEDIEKVVYQLVNDEDGPNVVGICGMGGLGKTTLAIKVFQDVTIKQHFSTCVWVYVSKEFEETRIFREICNGLPNSTADGNRSPTIEAEICEVLGKRKCLVVLDDIWENVHWDALKPAFQSIGNSSGSKILLTTRYTDLVNHADPNGYIHPIRTLSDEDSCKLLQRHAFLETDEGEKAKMEKKGKEMLKHCGGLPLAIVALGGVLSTKKTLVEWENVQKNISSYLMYDIIMEQASERQGLSAVLELSYYDLPYYLKACFTYLGNFPEDHEISTQRLYRLWEAEGLVTTTDVIAEIQGESLDGIAELCLNQLVKRNMVQVKKTWQNGKMKSCQLHDVMRAMCLKKCKEINFHKLIKWEHSTEPQKHSSSSSVVDGKLRRCALYLENGMYVDSPFKPSDSTPCIRSLLVFSSQYAGVSENKLFQPRKFFTLLRVLDVENVFLKMLPKGIGKLIHLRYLSIKGTYIRVVPSCIWKCKYLETLDLRSNEALKLGNKLWKLERLRHLYLPCHMELMNSHKLILSDGQLRQMETLTNFDKNQCQIKDLPKMDSLKIFSMNTFKDGMKSDTADVFRSFLNMEDWKQLMNSPVMRQKRLVNSFRLDVRAEVINEDQGRRLSVVSKNLCIRELKIYGKMISEAEMGDIFPPSLKKVILWDCEIGEEGISVLEKLPHLKQLQLRGKAIRGHKLSFSRNGFPSLIDLCIIDVEELVVWEVGEDAAPNLKWIKIGGCPKLLNNRLYSGPKDLERGVRQEDMKAAYGLLPHFVKAAKLITHHWRLARVFITCKLGRKLSASNRPIIHEPNVERDRVLCLLPPPPHPLSVHVEEPMAEAKVTPADVCEQLMKTEDTDEGEREENKLNAGCHGTESSDGEIVEEAEEEGEMSNGVVVCEL